MRGKKGVRTSRLQGLAFCLVLTGLLSGGCVSAAGRLAAKSIEGVGGLVEKTTVAAIKTTGRVAVSTTKAVVSTAGKGSASVGTTAFVTFQDTAAGLSRQVPYSEGLHLFAASQTAKVRAGFQAFELLRHGRRLLAAPWSAIQPGAAQDLVLQPGDVIRTCARF